MQHSTLILIALVLAMAPTHAARGPVAAFPLAAIVHRADAIAIVQVGSALFSESDGTVEYQIKVDNVLRGDVRDGCVMGFPGLKAGKTYVVFLRGEPDGMICSNPSLFGVLAPTTLEVDKAHGLDGSEQVKLDVLSIIPPRFADSTVRRNIAISVDGEEEVTIVGTVVPLSSFISYVSELLAAGDKTD